MNSLTNLYFTPSHKCITFNFSPHFPNFQLKLFSKNNIGIRTITFLMDGYFTFIVSFLQHIITKGMWFLQSYLILCSLFLEKESSDEVRNYQLLLEHYFQASVVTSAYRWKADVNSRKMESKYSLGKCI